MKLGKQVTIFDAETGEIIRDAVSFGSQNGEGWTIMFRETLDSLINFAPDFSTLKVFLKLSTKQEYEGGIKITKQAIADELKISYVSTIKAFKWLKENGYVKERKINGVPEFLLNPNVTTCGKNRKAKIALWNSIP